MLSFGSLLLFSFLTAPAGNPEFIIQTIAGGGGVGDNGPATSALLIQAEGIAADARGNLYVADAGDHRLRRISSNGMIETIAGTGFAGFSGDGGPAVLAQLNRPYGVARDWTGNLYVADLGNGRVRRIDPNGTIRTVARLTQPRNLALDAQGNLYISDFGAHTIFQLTPYGNLVAIAGTGKPGFAGDGGNATLAQFAYPAGLAVDLAGVVYVADSGNGRIRRISSGVVSTIADVPSPSGLALDLSGHLYIASSLSSARPLPSPISDLALVVLPAEDVACVPGGALFTVTPHYVQRIVGSAAPTIIGGAGEPGSYGDGGPATLARLAFPASLSLDRDGNLYVADLAANRIRKITPAGIISTLAGGGDPPAFIGPAGIAADGVGNVFVTDSGNNRVRRVGNGGVITTVLDHLNAPSCVRVGPDGTIYVCDTGNNRVLRVNPAGAVSTVISIPSPSGLALASDGVVYVSSGPSVVKVTATGPAVVIEGLNAPSGLAINAGGELLIVESGRHRVLKLGENGAVAAIAGIGIASFSGDGGSPEIAGLNAPTDIASDSRGNLYVADAGNGRVRELFHLAAEPVVIGPLQVVNSATMQTGPIAPGEIVTIFGAGFDPDRAGVTFDGKPSTVFYAGANQLNVLAPTSLKPGSVTAIAVTANDAVVAEAKVAVVAAAPGIFTFSNGSGQAAALNQDGSLNSADNPAARGDIVVLFATGDGGSTSPLLRIGGYPGELSYAGPAPGYPGLMQINARVPAGFLPGGAQEVILSFGTAASPPGVTIAVH